MSENIERCLIPEEFVEVFQKVPAVFNATPALAIKDLRKRLLHPYIRKNFPQIYKPAKAAFEGNSTHQVKNIESIIALVRYLPDAYVLKKFSTVELIALKASSVICFPTSLEEQMSMSHSYHLWNKACLSSWHKKYKALKWNTFVKFLACLKGLNFGPDFTFEIDFTTGCNSKGYSCVKRLFIDGEIGLFLQYKGKHVITIALNLVQAEKPQIIIEQIQLVNKRGNRFLYKMGDSYMETLSKSIYFAFKPFKILMPTSGRVIPAIQTGYIDGMGKPSDSWYAEIKQKLDDFNTTVKVRIAEFYDQPFKALNKTLTQDNYWEIQKA